MWAYCADENGNALPPVCSNPEDSSPSDHPKPCTPESSCSCDKPVTQPTTENPEAVELSAPSRSYPPAQVIQWGETPNLPTVGKNLKDLQSKSSSVAPVYMAEYPDDVEPIYQQSGNTFPPDKPKEFNVDTPPSRQDINSPLPDTFKGGDEMFNLNTEPNKNTPVPVQQQTPPNETPNGLELEYQPQNP